MPGKGRRVFAEPYRPENNGSVKQTVPRIAMIQFIPINLKKLFKQGRRYKWERPEKCPRCGHYKIWGHGFAARLFDGFVAPLLLKCYRCPGCGLVITLRPDTHFAGFQASIETIRSKLSYRISRGRWPPGLSTSRQRHWLSNLRRKIKAYLTQMWAGSEMAAFELFLSRGQVPVSAGYSEKTFTGFIPQ